MKTLFTLLALIVVHVHASGQKAELQYRDHSVNEIKLRNPASVLAILGNGKNYVDQHDDETEVVNRDGSQLLTMIFHPGGTTNEFHEFRVSYNTRNSKPDLTVATNDFVSGKNIKLGLTEKQVKSKLGPPSGIKTENGITVWRYETHDANDLYFGRYDFKDGKLIQFWFGEAYP